MQSGLADHFFGRPGQSVQHGFIRVQKNTVQGKDGASNRTLAEDGGKPLFRLLQRDLALLAFGNVDEGALDQAASSRVGDNVGPLQDPENRSIFPELPGFVVQHLAVPAQGLQKRAPFRRLHVVGLSPAGERFFFGVKPVHFEERAVAVQQRAPDAGDVDPGHIAFKQGPVLSCRSVGYFSLILKHGQDHAKGHQILGQVPNEIRRADLMRVQESRHRKNQAPGHECS